MVVTIAWAHSWIAISISLIVLLILVLFLLFCLCFSWEPSALDKQQMYTINEEEGIMKVENDNNKGLFNKFTNTGGYLMKTNFNLFANSGNKASKSVPNVEKYSNLNRLERELMDSRDFHKDFNSSVLCIDKDQDAYGSRDSLNTFYSVYPTRRNSLAYSMHSAKSYANLETV